MPLSALRSISLNTAASCGEPSTNLGGSCEDHVEFRNFEGQLKRPTGFLIRGPPLSAAMVGRILPTVVLCLSVAVATSNPLIDESTTDHRAHSKPGAPVYIVDWDSDGKEEVSFDASESHSHFFNSELRYKCPACICSLHWNPLALTSTFFVRILETPRRASDCQWVHRRIHVDLGCHR